VNGIRHSRFSRFICQLPFGSRAGTFLSVWIHWVRPRAYRQRGIPIILFKSRRRSQHSPDCCSASTWWCGDDHRFDSIAEGSWRCLDIFAVCSPFVGWSLALLSFRPRNQGSATRTDRARFAVRAAVAGSGKKRVTRPKGLIAAKEPGEARKKPESNLRNLCNLWIDFLIINSYETRRKNCSHHRRKPGHWSRYRIPVG